MDLELQGKTVIITGGSTGMGRVFSERFAEEKANVVVNYIVDPDEANAFSIELEKKYGIKAISIYADISNENDVSAMMKTVFNTFKRIDILINNAGIWPTCDFLDISYEDWKKVIDVNLNGTFLCSRIAADYMLKGGFGGHILNISSKSGISVSSGGHAHYATSKGGIVLLTKSMARELTGKGIIVNCVVPGMVATPMNQDKRDDLEMNAYYIKRLPMGKFSNPEDIANAVVFLASPKAEYTAGSIFDVTGGLLI